MPPPRSFRSLRTRGRVSRLAVVFGDQLDLDARAIRTLDKSRDAILMMEVANEAVTVPSHKQRVAYFLAAMRHFAQAATSSGYRVHYVGLDDGPNTHSFEGEIRRAVGDLKPEELVCTEPGEWRVREIIENVATRAGLALKILPDEHFLTSHEEFRAWMSRRRRPVMEFFYRQQRSKLGILLDRDARPVGGAWNLDKENRRAFKAAPKLKQPYTPRPDAITRDVMDLVSKRFPDNPGSLGSLRWPVTRQQAKRALKDFIEHRLPHFGTYQDAMWSGEPFLYHSLLSAALNLKLLNPRECVDAAASAYELGDVPLNCVEGFIRQIVGWREFIRGVYWYEGPEYGKRNALAHHGALPEFYWTGETEMVCMREAIGQVLDYGYGHHIQRLMVTGNFALIAGVDPRAVSDWYLGMYVDAVDWATLPNTLGMALHADGGVVGTKPYAASGKYIDRMSNYCQRCRYKPAEAEGPDACPFTTFYWDFLIRHRDRFSRNHRMTMVLRNVHRMTADRKRRIRTRAADLRQETRIGPLAGGQAGRPARERPA